MDNVEVVVCGSALHDRVKSKHLKETLLSEISAAGGFSLQQVETPTAGRVTPVVVLTGGVEREVIKIVSELPSPTLLIAHPGHNSLPASLEILAHLQQAGGDGQILFGSSDQIASGLSRELRVEAAWKKLSYSRVGVIGEPSEWLVASDIDAAFLKGRLGIELIKIGIDKLIDRIDQAPYSRKDVSAFMKQADSIEEPNKTEIRKALSTYVALKEVVDKYRLTSCTVRCFDIINQSTTTGCYALSRLNDEQVPAGCEGDMQALFSIHIGYLLSEETAFMGNVSSVNVDDNEIVLAHCTCPLSLATSYVVRSHFESGIGVGIAAAVPEGPCTVFRLGGSRLNRLFVCEGTIEQSTTNNELCRTQILVKTDEPVDDLLVNPIGNHHILVPGHHRRAIERFFERFLQQ